MDAYNPQSLLSAQPDWVLAAAARTGAMPASTLIITRAPQGWAIFMTEPEAPPRLPLYLVT